ncbi:MAG: aryl-sulfate sulfotransferase [Chitinophagaceae bacterium]|nr:aryl-sulfate sulfotransferase [Chitinophagaceae bacterium]
MLAFYSCSNPEIAIVKIAETGRSPLFKTIEVETNKPASLYICYWKKGKTDTVFISDTSQQGLLHRLTLTGLQQNSAYVYEVAVADKPSSKSDIRHFSTEDIPVEILDQAFLVESDHEALPENFKKGYVMIYRRDLPGMVYIVNARGELVWYNHAKESGYKVVNLIKPDRLLSLNAPLSYPTSYGNEIAEIKLDGDTLLHIKKGEKGFDKTIHHEILYNQAGQLVTLTAEDKTVDLSDAGGSKTDTVTTDGILVLDKQGNKIWEWSVADILSPATYPGILKEKKDWLHANSLSIDTDGNYIISFYLGSQIWKVDATSGKLIWKLGKSGDFKLTSGTWFGESHAVHKTSSNEITLFENGTGSKQSAILVYHINEEKKETFLKTKIVLPENFYSERMGSAYAVTDSTWLVSAAQSRNVLLIDSSGKVLWRVSTAFIPYRAVFIPAEDLSLFRTEKK